MEKIFTKYFKSSKINNITVSAEEGRVYNLKKGYPVEIKASTNDQGYKYINITNEETNKRQKVFVHSLVSEFVENLNPELYDKITHINGDKSDNKVENLRSTNNSEIAKMFSTKRKNISRIRNGDTWKHVILED